MNAMAGSVNLWKPIGGYDFLQDRVSLPPHTIAPAYTSRVVQLIEGEPDALQQLGEAIKQAAGDIPLGRLVCEAQGGTAAEPRLHCQLIYGVPGSFDSVDYVGAREELTEHPRLIGETLIEMARSKRR